MQLILDSEDLGEEYLKALEKVLAVRKERRHQYGDTFLEDEEIFLRLQIENKVKRLKINFENEKISEDKSKESTAIDSIIDNIHYSIFLLAVHEKSK